MNCEKNDSSEMGLRYRNRYSRDQGSLYVHRILLLIVSAGTSSFCD